MRSVLTVHRFAPVALAALFALSSACHDEELTSGGGGGAAEPDAASGDTAEPDGAEPDADAAEPGPAYEATIRRTRYGVPHISAADLGSLAFGQGYAYAEDHACILADQIVRALGQRARYFGPGEDDRNVKSDMAMRAMRIRKYAEEGWGELSADAQAAVRGYAAGYSHFVETRADDIAVPCRGQDFVQAISETDLLTYYLMVALYGSGLNLIDYIANAAPPGADETGALPMSMFPDFRDIGMASNGWGIGADRTASGRGMVAVNPHFPWEGERKFSEVHLTIPGEVDIYGAALMGATGVQIGFNEHVAWTHTVTTSRHFNFYKLDLVEGDPTAYLYDGEPRAMEAETWDIEVLGESGEIDVVQRTTYRSHYGPIINVPPLGWSESMAVTFRDANEANFQLIDVWLDMDRATNLDEFKAALGTHQGIPWVNTMYADKDGNAFFADASRVPNLSAEAQAAWEDAVANDFLTGLAYQNGIILMDGSDSKFEWVDDPAARAPGIVPFKDAPQLERSDFVANANDSHWLTHPEAPLEGYSIFWGDERTPRGPRTRMNLFMLTETGEGAQSGADGKFDLGELADAMLGNRAAMVELLLDAVLARCDGAGEIETSGGPVDIADACAVLAGWDRRLHVASVGAVLWRQWLSYFEPADFYDAGALFEVAFDPDDPLATPNTLAPAPAEGGDPALQALAEAKLQLTTQGIAIDSPLGDVQFTKKGAEILPIPGGTGFPEGAFNVVTPANGNNTLYPSMTAGAFIDGFTGLSDEGYVIRYGSSIVMAIEFTDDGPRAKALLSYSQSSDPASPHFADQTALFSEGLWRDVDFTEAAIAADPELSERVVSNP
jgi:acyl-homoserine-lactone acylase